MTSTRDKLMARMVELVQDEASPWEVVPGLVSPTIRRTWTVETPEYARGTGFGRWDQDTYDQHVFLTLTHKGFLMRRADAPWVGAHDGEIPYWLAEKILADPELGLDTHRQLELKRARKAGIRGDGVRGYR